VIAVDSSAIVAIILNEPEARAIAARLAEEPPGARRVSVASYLESGAVLASRRTQTRMQAIDDLEAFLTDFGITLVPVDMDQARMALRARIEHGRGNGSWRQAQLR
jgi:ribonuclease VapC